MAVAEIQLYTVPEVAALLKVSESKAWAMVARGDIPSVLVGGNRRVSTQALWDYIKSLTH